MTTFTEIGAAIEEAAWLSHIYKKPYCVYQRSADEMEVSESDSSRNPMLTTGQGGTVNTEHRSAA